MSDLKTHCYKKPLLMLLAIGSVSLAGCQYLQTHQESKNAIPDIQGDICDGSVVATRKEPRFSGRALGSYPNGWVLSHVTYDASGKVTDVGVVASTPKGYYEKQTLDAITKWTFKPSESGGSCGLMIEYRFD